MPFVNFGLFCGTYGQLGQGIAHAQISGNCFMAIVFPYRNKQAGLRTRDYKLELSAVLLHTVFACLGLFGIP